MKQFLFLFCLLLSFTTSFAQEFPKKEFIMHLRVNSGIISNFKGAYPDQYTGSIQLIPQYTFVENVMRGGLVLGGMYAFKSLQGIIGPTISFKLKTLGVGFFGTGGNLHLSIDHLWGTKKEALIGGGFNADIANKIVLSLTGHRDYKLNSWWIQTGVAFRISKVKQPPHP